MRQLDASLTPLWSLVSGLNLLLSQNVNDDAVCCAVVAKRLHRILRADWLPAAARSGADDGYQRHLLHEDESGRFSIGSFVWKPGQETPIHDHTCWGVLGVIEGTLDSENFETDPHGQLSHTSTLVLRPGVTTWLTPADGDIHRIANRSPRITAISIHVYGAAFAAVSRTQYDVPTGAPGRIARLVAQDEAGQRPAPSIQRL